MLRNKRIITIVALVFFLFNTVALAQNNAVVSIGKDLNVEQRVQIMNLLGADESDRIIEVSNEEERQYLGSYVDSKILGTRAISSSYVQKLKAGQGIMVETYNITWVTEDMLINALITAGVKDAKVVVAAPFDVSGTAALTGVIKGFEDMTGESISEEEKQIASEEIATTGQLGDDIGQTEATEIMKSVKEQVVESKLTDPEEIKKVIEDVSSNINIQLTEEQKNQIAELMKKISSLDLNVEDIKVQLKNISDKLVELGKSSEEVKSIVGRILDFVKGIFDRISGVFN